MRLEEVRTDLCVRLRARQGEIEEVALTRVNAVAETSPPGDPEYLKGLRATVSAAIEYGIEALEQGDGQAPAIPTTLLAQSRLAARHGISLDTVLRRYLAGYTLLADFVIEESERGELLNAASLKRLMRAYGGLFDRVIAAVTEEFKREARETSSPEERRVDRVRMLLAGELVDTAEIDYDFGCRHLSLVASGGGLQEVRDLTAPLDCRLLAVRSREGVVWAWVGSRRGVEPDALQRRIASCWSAAMPLAMGEPGTGLAGWRLSHRQAHAALLVASKKRPAFARYGDVALLASTLHDELLATSLRSMYLTPLSRERDGGALLRETLKAYFAANRNGASAAAALKVSRQTVSNRLSAIERRLGRPLPGCAAEVEAALRLWEFEDLPEPDAA